MIHLNIAIIIGLCSSSAQIALHLSSHESANDSHPNETASM